MRRVILVLILSASGIVSDAQGKDSLLTVFWNLENFFDYHDNGTGESDKEFSSQGSRRWTSRRFYQKCHSISKGLFWIGDRYGRMPDVIGVAEVENKWVLNRLISSTLLRKYDYRIIHQDSKDRRGIDVALIYRNSRCEILDTSFHKTLSDGQNLDTRDILQVRMRYIEDGSVYDFLVNHHPSKYGGSRESESRRLAAMKTMVEVCDSLYANPFDGAYRGIISMGDFNDTPSGVHFGLLDGKLVNACSQLYEKGEGRIRFEGKWELIDMFWVSPWLYDSSMSEILYIPFLMTRDRKHPGEKPLRTYSGPRYIGGVSDHCPVLLLIQ